MTTPARWVEYAANALRRKPEPPLIHCDYCDEGDTPVEGWHILPDLEGYAGTARIPCPRHP